MSVTDQKIRRQMTTIFELQGNLMIPLFEITLTVKSNHIFEMKDENNYKNIYWPNTDPTMFKNGLL